LFCDFGTHLHFEKCYDESQIKTKITFICMDKILKCCVPQSESHPGFG